MKDIEAEYKDGEITVRMSPRLIDHIKLLAKTAETTPEDIIRRALNRGMEMAGFEYTRLLTDAEMEYLRGPNDKGLEYDFDEEKGKAK